MRVRILTFTMGTDNYRIHLSRTNMCSSQRNLRQILQCSSLAILLLTTTLLKFTEAYIITLDAHSEDCFFEKAIANTKLGFTFEVIEGGFYDIDVSIYDPDGNIIHQESKASSNKYTIEANKDGPYKYCFSNKMSTVTPKVVMFSIETARQVQNKMSGAKDQEKLNDMVKDLTNSMTSVKHELEYLSVRDRIHRQINESTNSRVVVWTWVEFLILLCVSLGQVVYLKRFFEVRRVI